LLQNGKKPTDFSNSTDDGNAEWIGGKEPIQVETDLGDFTASYAKVDEGIEVSITASNNFAVDDLDEEFTKKTVKLEFGVAPTTP
jgi:hypothetical protein